MAVDNPILFETWKMRTAKTHEEHTRMYAGGEFDFVLIGDSMVERWNTTGRRHLASTLCAPLPSTGAATEGPARVALLGIGGDSVQNLLFRLREKRALLPRLTARHAVVLMIGTNNLAHDVTAGQIAEGVLRAANVVRSQTIATRVFLLTLPPFFVEAEERTAEVNAAIAALTLPEGVTLVENMFDGFELEEHYDDLVHFNERGYAKWAERLRSLLVKDLE